MDGKLKSHDICYVVAHGFAARMLLQTGLILRLTERGKSVALIVPDAQDENWLIFENNPLVSVFEASMDNNIFDDDYMFKRKYYLEEIKENPALWEKHIQAVRYNTSKHPWRRIRPFLYYRIYQLIKKFPSIRARFIANEKQYLKSKSTVDLVAEINPKLVVSTYPVSLLEAKVLFAAQQRGIKTTIHLLSWDNISCKGRFPVLADNYIVWGPIMRDELQEYYGISEEKIAVCGVPHFDRHVEVKNNPNADFLREELGTNPDEPYIFMAMSSPYFAPHEIDLAEYLSQRIKDNFFGEKTQLIIRPHPQNVSGFLADKSWLPRLEKLRSTRVAVDFPKMTKSKMRWGLQHSDMDRLSNILAACTVCLNCGSTVSIDALMVGKGSILTSFDGEEKLDYWKSARRLIDYNHLAKFIKIGGASPVFSYQELEIEIKKYLADKNYKADARTIALQQQCLSADGQSTTRVVDILTGKTDILSV